MFLYISSCEIYLVSSLVNVIPFYNNIISPSPLGDEITKFDSYFSINFMKKINMLLDSPVGKRLKACPHESLAAVVRGDFK
jgi:hypothetical protein